MVREFFDEGRGDVLKEVFDGDMRSVRKLSFSLSEVIILDLFLWEERLYEVLLLQLFVRNEILLALVCSTRRFWRLICVAFR